MVHAGVGAIIVTAADVSERLLQTDTDIRGLDAAIAACRSITDATKAQWNIFKEAWVKFVIQTEEEIYSVPFTGQSFGAFDPSAKMAQIDGFNAQLSRADGTGWQDLVNRQCGTQGPSSKPPPTPDPAWLSAVKWGALALVAVVAIPPVVSGASTLYAAAKARRALAPKKKLAAEETREPRERDAWIRRFRARHGRNPSFDEMNRGIGVYR